MVTPALVAAILDGYPLDPWNTHGVTHWARMTETARLLAPHTGARLEVVELFCLLHDARRRNEWRDPRHGERGGKLARELHGRLFELDDAGLELLVLACWDHTQGLRDGDVTVQTCWDCDRLDLGRVGFTVDPLRLCTAAGRHPQVIAWAADRARRRHKPPEVLAAWGL